MTRALCAAALLALLGAGCGGDSYSGSESETDSAVRATGLRIVDWEASLIRKVEGSVDAAANEIVVTATSEQIGECLEPVCEYLLRTPEQIGPMVLSAEAETHPALDEPAISIDLTRRAEYLFREVTHSVAQRPGGHMGLIFDGRLLSLPSIDRAAAKSGLNGKAGIRIAGAFSEESTAELAAALSER